MAETGTGRGLSLGWGLNNLLTLYPQGAGASPSFGGGIAYFVSRKVAVDFGLKWANGTFTEAEYQGDKETIDVSATSARASLGVSFWNGRC